MTTPITGGCLCGAVRYEARGEPIYTGYCYCDDCRKASGSGFIPFMGFPATALNITGAVIEYRMRHADGRELLRNSCSICGGLVFGGKRGAVVSHTIYAGSLDDPSQFKPVMAIFLSQRPAWVPLPSGLTAFEKMPG